MNMFPKWFLGVGTLNTDESERVKNAVVWHQFQRNRCLDGHCQYLLRAGVFVMMTAMFVEGWKGFSV